MLVYPLILALVVWGLWDVVRGLADVLLGVLLILVALLAWPVRLLDERRARAPRSPWEGRC
jgi:hypothetical protein